MINSNILPNCFDYANFLNLAVSKFNISINDARNLYGRFTYSQWNKILQ